VRCQPFDLGPLRTWHFAQQLPDTAPKALRIAIADQNVGRCLGEKLLELGGAASYRYIQMLSGQHQPRMALAKAQIAREHDLVIVDVLGRGTAQFDGQDRHASPCEPADQAVHDHPVGEARKCTPGFRRFILHHDFSQRLLADQLRVKIPKHQREKAQRYLHGSANRGLCSADFAQQCKAAATQWPGAHAEEFVVQRLGELAPQPSISARGHTCVFIAKRGELQPQAAECFPARRTALLERFTDQVHGDRVLACRRNARRSFCHCLPSFTAAWSSARNTNAYSALSAKWAAAFNALAEAIPPTPR